MSVNVRDNELEFALKRFKTEVARSGTLSIAKERANGYKKPGVRRKEEKKINTINSRRNARNNNSRRNYNSMRNNHKAA